MKTIQLAIILTKSAIAIAAPQLGQDDAVPRVKIVVLR
jgi:hypothetical protein